MERLEREKLTVRRMVEVYCRKHHRSDKGALCGECSALLEYALQRLEKCPKGNAKSSCRKCEIHCYAPLRREKMRQVMRYVGPRMIFIHPWSAILHLLSEIRH